MLQKEIWLITGAAGALGSALATSLAGSGAQPILLDRDRRGLDLLADRIERETKVSPFLMPMDLSGTNNEEYQKLADSIKSNLSKLNGVIHCAALQRGLIPHVQLSEADWWAGLQVNFNAPYWLSRALLPLLSASGGRLVFPLESLATMAGAYRGIYGIGQWALHAAIRQMAAEWRSLGVQVLGIETGPFYSALYSTVRPADRPDSLPAAAGVAEALLAEILQPAAAIMRVLSPGFAPGAR